ncbi:zinc finger MYM-type protein 3-like [Mytilus californianus]|uniref:zinc finger MYM-type protein 3-like n=1 Tax=Mytilus californianus TaxID=6549 RepID=UPI0022453BA0|nr:zinc finger MYM-type protein 3-like [Mytilus californianus]
MYNMKCIIIKISDKINMSPSKYFIFSLAESTKKKIKWAYNLFNTWKTQRNAIAVADLSLNISIISPDLEVMTKDELCFALSRFICEIKKENGEEYPGQTLYEILINIQLYLEGKGKYFKFLNEDCFIQIKNTLDHTMKERARSGLGTHKKKAQEITYDEENMLWEKGILGNTTPQKLLDTTIYLFGLNFALRAGKEHRDLRWENSQISEHTDTNGDSYLVYREDVSKSNQGGLKSRKCKQKVVFAYENKDNPDRCIVKFYRDYISHCPEKRPKNAFYLKPIPKSTGQVWFAAMPVGINMLTATIAGYKGTTLDTFMD